MIRTLLAFGQIACTWAAKWLFFWPGNGLLAMAEWCQRHADARRPLDRPLPWLCGLLLAALLMWLVHDAWK